MIWLLLALVACGPTLPSGSGPTSDLRVPHIVDARLECDPETATWLLEVHTDAWSGGGSSAWTTDARYVEVHPVPSVAAASDASADLLRLVLPVVVDWREARPGGGTDFDCASEPDVLLVLNDVRGEPVDCRQWGPDPEIWNEVEGLEPCS